MLGFDHEVAILKGLGARLYRLCSAIMLLAALSFAFHTGVVLADFNDIADGHGHAAASVETSAHVDGTAHADVHRSAADADHDAGGHQGHCKVPCCGSIGCTIALLASGILLFPVRIATTAPPLPMVTSLSGVEPRGLKRPPKTLSLG